MEENENTKRSFLAPVQAWYVKYERPASSVALIGGFVLDFLTLQRVDALWENSWIIFHLTVVATCIILLNRKKATSGTLDIQENTKSHFWYVTAMQFSFGGLLSAFLLFYFRSSSFFVSWPFLLILALAFAANERLKQHIERTTFHISFFFLALYLFAIYIIPVLTHQMGPFMFALSGAACIVVFILFLSILQIVTGQMFLRGHPKLLFAIIGIFSCINILYVSNIMPPIPLSLKEGDIYHSIEKDISGSYVVLREKKTLSEYFSPYQLVHTTPGVALYAYSAVFSPTKLNTEIVHVWQRYDLEEKEWQTMSTIPLSLTGGRNGGYRTFSLKENMTSGKWRVSVETPKGQVVGRLYFTVVTENAPPILFTEIES